MLHIGLLGFWISLHLLIFERGHNIFKTGHATLFRWKGGKALTPLGVTERHAASHWRTDFTDLGVSIILVIFEILSFLLIIVMVCQTLHYHLRFSQQCYWIFKSVGMLYCVVGCMVPTCPMIQHHVPENLIFINWTCYMEFYRCLPFIIMIWNVTGKHFACLIIQGGAAFIRCFDLQRSVVALGRAWN